MKLELPSGRAVSQDESGIVDHAGGSKLISCRGGNDPGKSLCQARSCASSAWPRSCARRALYWLQIRPGLTLAAGGLVVIMIGAIAVTLMSLGVMQALAAVVPRWVKVG